ncbi:hypothetical protein CK203_089245 [Vitis vinifera]|uniref:Uncharacterized protein n=1 Tax=Vitis vinifera TaxID=29760 RepID=A0A438CZW2_VITVI|nr:hypothetical protein CK203_089245 [Vitis vinifera]
MLGCKPIDTPMEVNKREGNLDEKMSVDMGRSYGRGVQDPEISQTTPGKGLFFRKNEEREVKIYTDADWTGSESD